MKIARFLALTLVLAGLGCGPAWAQLKMTIKDGHLGYEQGAAKTLMPVEKGALTKVDNSDLVFALVEDLAFLKTAGYDKPSLFFFDKAGNQAAMFSGSENFDVTMCAAASLSPDGQTIALDNGTWLVRIWAFYKFPDFVPVTTEEDPFLSYLTTEGWAEGGGRDLTWVDSGTVIVTDISEAPVARPCDSDPCEPTDVVVLHLAPWRANTLAKGSELCDYRFISLKGDVATVSKICVKSIDDWRDAEKPRATTQERLTIPR